MSASTTIENKETTSKEWILRAIEIILLAITTLFLIFYTSETYQMRKTGEKQFVTSIRPVIFPMTYDAHTQQITVKNFSNAIAKDIKFKIVLSYGSGTVGFTNFIPALSPLSDSNLSASNTSLSPSRESPLIINDPSFVESLWTLSTICFSYFDIDWRRYFTASRYARGAGFFETHIGEWKCAVEWEEIFNAPVRRKNFEDVVNDI